MLSPVWELVVADQLVCIVTYFARARNTIFPKYVIFFTLVMLPLYHWVLPEYVNEVCRLFKTTRRPKKLSLEFLMQNTMAFSCSYLSFFATLKENCSVGFWMLHLPFFSSSSLSFCPPHHFCPPPSCPFNLLLLYMCISVCPCVHACAISVIEKWWLLVCSFMMFEGSV